MHAAFLLEDVPHLGVTNSLQFSRELLELFLSVFTSSQFAAISTLSSTVFLAGLQGNINPITTAGTPI